MSALLDWLLDSESYMPHGHCYLWQADTLWLNVGSDALIAASYYAIPLVLFFFVRRRGGAMRYGWMALMFAAFIFLCGTTHLYDIWTVWNPEYRIEGAIKLVTGLVSATTAAALVWIMPRAIALRTPLELQREVEARTAELAAANLRLQQEIAARERTEEALRANEARYRATFENAGVGIAHVAPDGRWLRFNQALCEITGYAEEALRARTFADITHAADLEADWLQAKRLLAGEIDRYAMEKRYVRPDGSTVWVLLTVSLLRSADGEPEYFISVVHDISERIAAREERQRVEEALQEANRRKDAFLATLSHELRNPLAPILNAVEFMRAKGLSDPALQNARDIIARQVHHLVRLVDDLLEVARITSGRIELRKAPVSLELVLAQAVEAVQPLMEEKGHRLSVELATPTLPVQADLVRLVQVLVNLLNNAAKYTLPGGRIALTAASDGEAVTIRIRDNGIGMTPDQLTRIFDLFWRAESARPHAQEGLGIGLTLARELTRLHGGELTAASAGPGCGSEFVLRLPLAAQTETAAGEMGPTSAERGGSPRRVLVVDDNPDAAASVALNLELAGYRVHTAHGGAEALQSCERFAPQIVLLDLGMPGMSGYDVARTLRARPGGDALWLLALTGWGQPEDKRRAYEAGFDEHLTKPVDCAWLLARLAAGRRDRIAGG